MMQLLWLVGVLLALGLIVWVYRTKKHSAYVVGYVIAVLLYVVFAIVSMNPFWVLTEVMAAGFFLVFAWLALKYSYWFLVFGWLIHTVWDNIVVGDLSAPYVPAWYPDACLGFDLVMAVAVVVHCVRVEAGEG